MKVLYQSDLYITHMKQCAFEHKVLCSMSLHVMWSSLPQQTIDFVVQVGTASEMSMQIDIYLVDIDDLSKEILMLVPIEFGSKCFNGNFSPKMMDDTFLKSDWIQVTPIGIELPTQDKRIGLYLQFLISISTLVQIQPSSGYIAAFYTMYTLHLH